MNFSFRRYDIEHGKKTYTVLIPDRIKDNLFINTLDDDWYNGPFLTGSVRAMRVLSACFAVLGFNPYVIIYLPIRGDRIPNAWSGNPETGNYDVVFRTNRAQLKDKDWKEIRSKMKKAKWTRYVFEFREERVRNYFKMDIDFLDKVDPAAILKGAGSHMWLSCGTVFCSFPRSIYRRCSVEVWEYIKEGLANNKIGGYYNEGYDYWTADMICSVTGWTRYCSRKKYSYEKCGICLNLEIYDIHIANRRLKKKDYLIKYDRSELPPRDNPAVSMFKIKLG